MIWEDSCIDFLHSFYHKTYDKKGQNLFPYLQTIKFKYKGRVTNIIERVDNDEWSDWRHTASNNFHNLVNTNFIRFNKDR